MSGFKHWNISEAGMAFDPQTGESFQLNRSATLIIEMIRQGEAPETIAKEISQRFGVPYEQALTDVLEFQVHLEILGKAA